jgi:acyl dehydratase
MSFVPPPPDADAMKFWCEIMRDDNAIHTDPEAAARAGFGPRRVNPGPANLAALLNGWLAAFPGQDPERIEAAFLGNVFEGDALDCRFGPDGEASLHRQDAPDAPVLRARITPRAEE